MEALGQGRYGTKSRKDGTRGQFFVTKEASIGRVFDRLKRMNPVYPQLAILLGFALLVVTVNAASAAHDLAAHAIRFSLWEPWCWELSSWLGLAAVFGPLLIVVNRLVTRGYSPVVMLGVFLVASVVFSALHVAIMVGSRVLIYHLVGRTYDFGPVLTGFIYEYRKDLVACVLAAGLVFLWHRRKPPVVDRPSNVEPSFLVSEKDSDTVVRAGEIFWVEAQGNYIALHLKDRVHLVRKSLKQAEQTLKDAGFVRTHRSALVNLKRVQAIKKLETGELKLEFRNGKLAPLTPNNRGTVVAKLSGLADTQSLEKIP